METLGSVTRDVRCALRAMRRNPTFSVAFVLTLALGIGATTAIFAVVDAVMLRPLPYQRPDRLVEVWLSQEDGAMTLPFFPSEQVRDLESSLDVFTGTAFSEYMSFVRTDGEPERLGVLTVSHDLDDLLGVSARIGRTFVPEDARPGAPRVIVLTHGYWVRTGSPPEVVGSTLELEGEPWTVVGVLPADFKYPVAGTVEAWVPLTSEMTAGGRTQTRALIIGRLPEGLGIEAAQERADVISAALEDEQPTTSLGWHTDLRPVDQWRGNPAFRRSLWMLAAGVGLMLAIALANGTSLLLGREQDRVREWAVRRSLGAGAGQLLRRVLVETVILAATAGAAAALIASAALAAMRRIMPSEFEFSSVYTFSVGGRALGFAFLLAPVTGLVVGLVPAIRAATGRATPGAVDAPNAAPSRGAVRLSHALVISEVSLSMVLLSGAGLFLHSFAVMAGDDPGFEADELALASLQLPETRYPTPAERRRFADALVDRARSLPGVTGAAVTAGAPLHAGFSATDAMYRDGERIEGFARPVPLQRPRVSGAGRDASRPGTGPRAGRSRGARGLDRQGPRRIPLR